MAAMKASSFKKSFNFSCKILQFILCVQFIWIKDSDVLKNAFSQWPNILLFNAWKLIETLTFKIIVIFSQKISKKR
jgi:hypothetical protein